MNHDGGPQPSPFINRQGDIVRVDHTRGADMLVIEKNGHRALARGAEPTAPSPPLLADAWRFDPDWYLATYPDVAMAGVDPVRHYLTHGVKEDRNPNPSFHTAFYLSSNPDVAQAGIHPFLHYVLYGQREGRAPNALAPRPTRALRSLKGTET